MEAVGLMRLFLVQVCIRVKLGYKCSLVLSYLGIQFKYDIMKS